MSEASLSPNPAQAEHQLRPEQWHNVFSTFEELGLSNNPAERAGQVAVTTGEGMLDVATRLHTVLAPHVGHAPHPAAMKMTSPEGVVSAQLALPEERAGIFEHAASLIRELASKKQAGEDEIFLKRAANVTALAVVLAHNFEDANGRTARTMAHLIREGYDGTSESQRDFQTIGSNRPPSGFRINSFLPTGEGKNLSAIDLLTIAASPDIPLTEERAYLNIKGRNFDSPYAD